MLNIQLSSTFVRCYRISMAILVVSLDMFVGSLPSPQGCPWSPLGIVLLMTNVLQLINMCLEFV
jgi:hypothetical protein